MTDNHNGLQCVSLVKEYLKENQLIEPLILVLKQMLDIWGFNDPYTGGLSSYALFLLIVSFLQAKQTPNELRHVNLGRTLLEFLKYYAELDVKKFAIACSIPGHPNSRLNTYPIIDLEQTVSRLDNNTVNSSTKSSTPKYSLTTRSIRVIMWANRHSATNTFE